MAGFSWTETHSVGSGQPAWLGPPSIILGIYSAVWCKKWRSRFEIFKLIFDTMSGKKRTFGPLLANHLHYKWDPQIVRHNIEGDPAPLFLNTVERF